MEVVTSVVDYLNANPPIVITIASSITVMLMYLINHFANVSKLANYFLGLLAVPGVLGAVAVYGTTFPPKYAPIIAIVGQIMYAVYENLKTRIITKATATPEEQVLGPGV